MSLATPTLLTSGKASGSWRSHRERMRWEEPCTRGSTETGQTRLTGGSAAATTFSQKQPDLGSHWGWGRWLQGRPGRRNKCCSPILGHRSLAHSTYTQSPVLLDALSHSPPEDSQVRGTGAVYGPKAGEERRGCLLRPKQESELSTPMAQMYHLPERPKDLGPWNRFPEQNPEAQSQGHSHLQLKGELCRNTQHVAKEKTVRKTHDVKRRVERERRQISENRARKNPSLPVRTTGACFRGGAADMNAGSLVCCWTTRVTCVLNDIPILCGS